jgi:membrane associated rhomboid family serine protease
MGNVTNALLLSIGLVFILQLLTGIDSGIVTRSFIFNPYTAFSEPWRFLTSMFIHASFIHIFFNAYALFMFGSFLEQKVSAKDYLLIYLGAGLLGGMLYFLTTLSPWPPLCEGVGGVAVFCSALGASGAIYGIMGAVAVLMPDLRLFVLFFPMSIRQAVVLWFIMEFLGVFDTTGGIASAAHLGGLFFGLAYAWMLKHSQPPLYGAQAVYGHEVA